MQWGRESSEMNQARSMHMYTSGSPYEMRWRKLYLPMLHLGEKHFKEHSLETVPAKLSSKVGGSINLFIYWMYPAWKTLL